MVLIKATALKIQRKYFSYVNCAIVWAKPARGVLTLFWIICMCIYVFAHDNALIKCTLHWNWRHTATGIQVPAGPM